MDNFVYPKGGVVNIDLAIFVLASQNDGQFLLEKLLPLLKRYCHAPALTLENLLFIAI